MAVYLQLRKIKAKTINTTFSMDRYVFKKVLGITNMALLKPQAQVPLPGR